MILQPRQQIERLQYCCTWHVPPDKCAPEMIRELSCLKDADGLDRVRIRDLDTRSKAEDAIRSQVRELTFREEGTGENLAIVATLSPAAQKDIQDTALKQNITTLHNRVNELGVAEPVIQQQGADRIVVQLPGVQDVARAKQILGRTATLEIRMVDQEAMAAGTPGALTVPERKANGVVTPTPLKREVVVTGNQLNGASATLDGVAVGAGAAPNNGLAAAGDALHSLTVNNGG